MKGVYTVFDKGKCTKTRQGKAGVTCNRKIKLTTF